MLSKFKYDAWAKYLINYWDWQLPLLIEYGFPLDFVQTCDITCEKINHISATEYPAYLQEEMDNGAMFGPFCSPPIDSVNLSPFINRDRSSSK